jgi:WD40 repeat protein
MPDRCTLGTARGGAECRDLVATTVRSGPKTSGVTIGVHAPATLRRRFESSGNIRLWRLPVERRANLEGLAGITVGPDGDDAVLFLAAGEGQHMSSRALRWSLERGAPPEPLLEAVVPLTVARAAFDCTGRIALPRLVSVDEDPTWAGAVLAQGVALWSARWRAQDELDPPFARAERCWPIAFHPDGRHLAIASTRSGGTRAVALTLWDVDARRPVRRLLSPARRDVFDLAFAPSGAALAALVPHHGIELWDPRSGTLLARCPVRGMPYQLAFSPCGEHVAVSTPSGPIVIFEVPSGALAAELRVGSEGVTAIAFDPEDGRTIAAACGDRVRFLDANRGYELGSLRLATLAQERAALAGRGSLGRRAPLERRGDRASDEGDVDELAPADAHADARLGSPHRVVSIAWMHGGFVACTSGGLVWHWRWPDGAQSSPVRSCRAPAME